jgi:hypothetical protein
MGRALSRDGVPPSNSRTPAAAPLGASNEAARRTGDHSRLEASATTTIERIAPPRDARAATTVVPANGAPARTARVGHLARSRVGPARPTRCATTVAGRSNVPGQRPAPRRVAAHDGPIGRLVTAKRRGPRPAPRHVPTHVRPIGRHAMASRRGATGHRTDRQDPIAVVTRGDRTGVLAPRARVATGAHLRTGPLDRGN